MRDEVGSDLPMDEEKLKDIHKNAKIAAIKDFNIKAYGETNNELLKLKEKIREVYIAASYDNVQATKLAANSWLLNRWKNIDKSIKNHEIEEITLLEEELKNLQIDFDESGPNGPYREAFCLDFVNRCMGDATEFLMENMSSQFST